MLWYLSAKFTLHLTFTPHYQQYWFGSQWCHCSPQSSKVHFPFQGGVLCADEIHEQSYPVILF